MSNERDDAHRLIDVLDEEQLTNAVQVLRQFADQPSDVPEREFAWIGALSAEPELAERSSEILRQELGREA